MRNRNEEENLMNEPWISQKTLGLLIMVIFIPLGPIVGTLGGYFVPRGKVKKLTLGILITGIVLASILFLFGLIALLFGQPRSVWLMSGFFGLDLILCLGIIFWVFRKRIRDVELRQLMSEDLTLENPNQTHNEEEKEYSNE